jgi:hypothetical protein
MPRLSGVSILLPSFFLIIANRKGFLLNSPVRNTGIEMKNPPTAQTRVMEDFCRYLFVLETIRNQH